MNRRKLLRELGDNFSFPTTNNKDHSTNHDLKIFNFQTIAAAADNFSSTNKLGEGGFGPVYKAWQLWNEGKGLEIIDLAMDESCSSNEVLRFIHVGLLCVQDQAADRPTMSDVVSMLNNDTLLLPAPKQPTFFINGNSEELEAPEIKLKNCSINGVTSNILVSPPMLGLVEVPKSLEATLVSSPHTTPICGKGMVSSRSGGHSVCNVLPYVPAMGENTVNVGGAGSHRERQYTIEENIPILVPQLSDEITKPIQIPQVVTIVLGEESRDHFVNDRDFTNSISAHLGSGNSGNPGNNFLGKDDKFAKAQDLVDPDNNWIPVVTNRIEE
ncbi:hypothetical protein LWI29_004010 [Acer saccharum]|uniref:Uncharacterized protein n=1 Tax=Acer saccharum TaxID=4024 RepID=A0AA39VXQ0_ACESA|nr:hypothetical protein LWI29_004010 [Acer saccharum]